MNTTGSRILLLLGIGMGVGVVLAAAGAIAVWQQESTWDPKDSNPETPFLARHARVNDVVQYLAIDAGYDYFSNPAFSGEDYLITTKLNAGAPPMEQIEAIALLYGLQIERKDRHLYLFTAEQAAARYGRSAAPSSSKRSIGDSMKPPNTDNGVWVEDVSLNDVIRYLAKRDDLQFFYNPDFEQPNFIVTGRLRKDITGYSAVKQLAYHFNLVALVKEETLYVLTPKQWERAMLLRRDATKENRRPKQED